MSFFSTKDLIRKCLGLHSSIPSLIRIDRGPEDVYEFFGWEVTRKTWRGQRHKFQGILYRTKEQKIVMEFIAKDFKEKKIYHSATMYDSTKDALIAMNELSKNIPTDLKD